MREPEGGVPRLAERLNHLFTTVPHPDREGYWTNERAAAAITISGTPMSDGYISQLRNGRRDNPSARHLAAIAALFGVPVDYFFNPDTTARIDADLRMLAAIRDAGVQGLALRAHGLSRESLAGLEGIVEQVRRFERLPDHPGADGDEDDPPATPDEPRTP